MLVFEAKLKGKPEQFKQIDKAIRTGQFVRNSCLRYWEDNRGVGKNDLQKYCAVLAKKSEFPWAAKLNSMARQAHADRVWNAISRFFENCRNQVPGKKGYPRYKKHSRSVEYKTTGWKLSNDRKYLTLAVLWRLPTSPPNSASAVGFLNPKMIVRLRLKWRPIHRVLRQPVWGRRCSAEFGKT